MELRDDPTIVEERYNGLTAEVNTRPNNRNANSIIHVCCGDHIGLRTDNLVPEFDMRKVQSLPEPVHTASHEWGCVLGERLQQAISCAKIIQ